MKSSWKLWYATAKSLLRIAMRLYYRRVKVAGLEHVPEQAAVIFVSNHQNAFIDALNVAAWCRHIRQPQFMTRADIFKPPFDRVLRGLKMLPIYRQRDGLDEVKKNAASFGEVMEELSTPNGTTLIFPEGNHNRRRQLRPLQKGAARLAFQVAEKHAFQRPIYIVPVGLNYERHLKAHADLLVQYGEAIPVLEFEGLYRQHPNRAYVEVTRRMEAGMRRTLIHISDEAHFDTIDSLRERYGRRWQRQAGLPAGQAGLLAAGQQLVARLEALPADDAAWQAAHAREQEYRSLLEACGLRDHVVAGAPVRPGQALAGLAAGLLGLPVFLLGLLLNYPVYHLSAWAPGRYFKDDHFHSSVSFIIGYFGYPLYWPLQALVLWAAWSGWAAVLSLVLAPLTGRLALSYAVGVKKWRGRLRYARMLRRRDPQALRLQALFAEQDAWMQAVTEESLAGGKPAAARMR